MILTSIFNLIRGDDSDNEYYCKLYSNSNFHQIYKNTVELKLQWKGLSRISVFENHCLMKYLLQEHTNKTHQGRTEKF